MNHDELKAKLDTYLDGELPAVEAQELDRHMRECPACAAEALRRMQWKKAIRSVGERYVAQTPALLSAQKLSVPSAAWWPLRAPRIWWPTVAVALAIILVLAGITLDRQKLREARTAQAIGELVDLHVSTLASANPVDVVSSDRHTVKPWFAGKIPFTFDLPDLEGTQFELVGGRVTYFEQSPGAELLVRIRKHQISVFIFPDKSVPSDFNANTPIEARSFHLTTFTRNGLRYFVVGDVGVEDISALAGRLR